jgi:2,3-bisphosphoglycerate-independent phosphoglycerate mutase
MNLSCAISRLQTWFVIVSTSFFHVLETTNQVGHTGIYDAAVTAITETDKAVGTIYKAAQEAGYILLITADHGNAEQMVNRETGAPHTAHTTNPVPFIMTGDPARYKFVMDDDKNRGDEEEGGALCDVAPTILDLMVSHCSCCDACCADSWVPGCSRRAYQSLKVSVFGLSRWHG